MSEQITVIILNWRRFKNVNNIILPKITQYSCVREVIVVDCSLEGEAFNLNEKVTVVRATRDLGLDARFIAALAAKTELVLLQDDDLCLPECSINILQEAARNQPDMLHGCFGRNPTELNTYALGVDRLSGLVEMVLTRAVMTTRANIPLFFALREESSILKARAEFTALNSHPDNGEDIIFSYAVYQKYRRHHRIYCLEVEELPTFRVGISEKSFAGHQKHRTQIMRAARSAVGLGQTVPEISSPRKVDFKEFKLRSLRESAEFFSYVQNYKQEFDFVSGLSERISQLHTVLLEVSLERQPERYGEIGSRYGDSAAAVAYSTDLKSLKCFDLPNAGYGGRPESELTLQRVLEHFAPGRASVLLKDSGAIREEIRAGGSYDLFLIDGNHSAEGAEYDFETILPAMAMGGIVIIDDLLYHPHLSDVFSRIIDRHGTKFRRMERRLALTGNESRLNALIRGVGILELL